MAAPPAPVRRSSREEAPAAVQGHSPGPQSSALVCKIVVLRPWTAALDCGPGLRPWTASAPSTPDRVKSKQMFVLCVLQLICVKRKRLYYLSKSKVIQVLFAGDLWPARERVPATAPDLPTKIRYIRKRNNKERLYSKTSIIRSTNIS